MRIKRLNKGVLLKNTVYAAVFFLAVFIYLRVIEGYWQFADSAFIAGWVFVLAAGLKFCSVLDGFRLFQYGFVKLRNAFSRRDEGIIPDEHKSYAVFLKERRPPAVVYEPLLAGAFFVVLSVAATLISL